ncbi:MAG: hypothetical protein KHZ93_09960 [Clostridiales bacterium]|nr:hypothetical protein [Clostridiales bacterium]
MKRILIFCTALVMSMSLTSCFDNTYPIGQGTVAAFGDNRFYFTKDEFSENSFMLFDHERSTLEGAIDSGIRKYGEYSYIYTIGDKGYTKVNEKTGEVKQSKSLEDFSEDDQEIFRQLEQNEAGLEK